MKILVTNIIWQKPPPAQPLPTRTIVEVEDDTPAEALAGQVKYALWRATGVMPIEWEVRK